MPAQLSSDVVNSRGAVVLERSEYPRGARAEELGAALVAPPMDAGPTRITVVRDPQGAVFTASRFYPERL
jgi:predicted enzyme related to lactoylglutathione lyase